MIPAPPSAPGLLDGPLIARRANGTLRRSWPVVSLILPIAVVLLLLAAEGDHANGYSGGFSEENWPGAGYGPTSYAAELDVHEAQIELGRERVRNSPQEWLRHESLARALMTRAALTSDFAELRAAGDSLDAANALAPEGTGPLLTEAALAMLTHRIDRAEQLLASVRGFAVLDPAEQANIAELEGDVLFYHGDMEGAEASYRAVERIAGPEAAAFRRAVVAKARGDFDEAIALMRLGAGRARQSTPLQHASIALRIGGVEMARGNYDAARTWFERADREFPGHWLFEAHLAQAKALDGNLPEAIADLRRIAARAAVPEVMDALAIYLREAGREDESRVWAARAARSWNERLVQLPEAAYGHAFEHELAFGSPERLRRLAQRNLDARPFGEARIMMGEALLANGRASEALEQLELATVSGWQSAPLHALRANALQALGREREMRAARRAATQMNPRFLDRNTVLIRFSHP